jgi:signal peptidase I
MSALAVRFKKHRLVQAVLEGLWLGVLPALLAATFLKFFVPLGGVGIPGWVASIERKYPVPFIVALFFLFSFLARHWRFHVPGGRYASKLPVDVAPYEGSGDRLGEWAAMVELRDRLASSESRQRCRDATRRADVERKLGDLERAIASSDVDAARDATGLLQSLVLPVAARRRRTEALITVGAVILAAVVALGVKAKVVEPYRVLSSSMSPTFRPDDQVLGRKIDGSSIRRGDVVAFRSAAVTAASLQAGVHPDFLVKRVIGLPGDRIEMRGGVPVINGWLVPTCSAGRYLDVVPDGSGEALRGSILVEFLDDRSYLTLQTVPMPRFEHEYLVASGEVFVLGDSRGNSVDSRAYGQGHGGGVPIRAIDARADWFLLGTHRSGAVDLSRLFTPTARLENRLHVEGINADELETGIGRCLKSRPTETHPPPTQTLASAHVGAP